MHLFYEMEPVSQLVNLLIVAHEVDNNVRASRILLYLNSESIELSTISLFTVLVAFNFRRSDLVDLVNYMSNWSC